MLFGQCDVAGVDMKSHQGQEIALLTVLHVHATHKRWMRSRDVKACPNFQFIERKLKVLDPAKSLQMDIYFILYCVYMFSLLNIEIYICYIYIRIKSTLFKYCSNVKQFFFTFFKHKKFSYFFYSFYALSTITIDQSEERCKIYSFRRM